MADQKQIYVLIRVRKSGSQSLVQMVKSALPEANDIAMPPDPPVADLGVGLLGYLRRERKVRKRLLRLFGTPSYPRAWEKINREASHGDLVSGHFRYDSPTLPDWRLRFITLVRDPLERLYSEYRYCRASFLQRRVWRRFYLSDWMKVAGSGTFADYVDYLASFGDRFTNPLVGYLCGGALGGKDPFDFVRSRYFHYGVLEDLDHFVAGLSRKLGRDVPRVWKNRTRGDAGLSHEHYDESKVKALIGGDLKLYRAMRFEGVSAS